MDSDSIFTLFLFHESANAYLVGKEEGHRETDDAFWLPKSQVEMGQMVQKDGIEWGDFRIPDWLAEEKGLDFSLDGDEAGDGDLWEEFM